MLSTQHGGTLIRNPVVSIFAIFLETHLSDTRRGVYMTHVDEQIGFIRTRAMRFYQTNRGSKGNKFMLETGKIACLILRSNGVLIRAYK